MRLCTALAAASVFALLGCTDAPTTADPPSLELTDAGQRWDATTVNSHVYGSFRIDIPGGATVITGGPANFPGHPPAGPGTCDNGLWVNAQGKRTAGTLARPHPHCIGATSALEVVLEPISSCYSGYSTDLHPCGFRFGEKAPEAFATTRTEGLGISDAGDGIDLVGETTTYSNGTPPRSDMFGFGVVSGYAIDASTLGTTNRRVGTLTFDLDQLTSSQANYLDFDGSDGCTMDATILAPCLDLIILAEYAPLPAPAGAGTAQTVPGFLWISPASAPYNYIP
jgi:hypothetical protein